MTTNTDLRQQLTANSDFDRLINTVANDLFNRESKMYKYVQDIRENLKPIKPNNNLSKIKQKLNI